ncbi:MAG: hypothetical protein RLZ25_1429 [Pseudomonadota bacterium]|jgi:Flp pilus assembly protein CpaB
MFKSRLLYTVLFAALFAGASTLFISKLIGKPQPVQAVVQSSDKTTIMVAATNIPFLSTITEDQLRSHSIREDDLPSAIDGYFADYTGLIGKVATVPIHAGTPILREDVRAHDAGSALALEVRPDFRAVSVRVDDVRGVGGFLLRGNIVDLIATGNSPNSHDEPPKYIAEAVRVLAVDQEVNQKSDKALVAKAVTVEVSPAQVQEIVSAQFSGNIQMVLRNPEDYGPSQIARRNRPSMVKIFNGQDHAPMRIHECPSHLSCSNDVSGSNP